MFMLRQQDLLARPSHRLIIRSSRTRSVQPAIQMIATLWTNIRAIAGAERIFDFLDQQPDVVDKPDARHAAHRGRVELRDVWMSYNEDESVLRGVS